MSRQASRVAPESQRGMKRSSTWIFTYVMIGLDTLALMLAGLSLCIKIYFCRIRDFLTDVSYNDMTFQGRFMPFVFRTGLSDLCPGSVSVL